MDKIKQLYYERFLQHVEEAYTPRLKGAKNGHCMKITGLPLEQLVLLQPRLKSINPEIDTYILDEERSGDEYIHATKLIELRNDPDKTILIMVPSNSRTSAEDSYGDATFQNLSVIDLEPSFIRKLEESVPKEKEATLRVINQLISELDFSRDTFLTRFINYLLYLETHAYSDEAWGNGLYLFGMLPDSKLIEEADKTRRRFFINLEKISTPLSDFSITPVDRVVALPLQKGTKQKDLLALLNNNTDIVDRESLFREIHDNHPEFNYSNMPWIQTGEGGKIKIDTEIIPGKDPKKELVKEVSGDLKLSIPVDKKGKISFTIQTNPTPKDNPDIVSFEIVMVKVEEDEYSEIAVVKKAKVGTNKRASRKLSINIANGMFDDGDYLLRVRALDANGIVLDVKREFKEEGIQEAWKEAKEANPQLQMDQFRREHDATYANESAIFTIDNSGEEVETEGGVNKRSKVNSLTQAIITYRISHLIKGEDLEIPEEGQDRNEWVEGNLNMTYQFDFGPSFAYQIQLPKKLIQLERTFLENEGSFGQVEALLSGNPTDTTLLNPDDTADRKPKFVELKGITPSQDLLDLRAELFELIKNSAEEEAGLISTLDFSKNLSKLKTYLGEYEAWLREVLESDLDENTLSSLQSIDTVRLHVEMPDGGIAVVRMLTPLHPLRLAWMVNLWGLYTDWEQRTKDNPKHYGKSWYRKLDKLFQGEIPMEVAPLVLNDRSLKEAYQYAGELTFGWALYAQPRKNEESMANGMRQLKSYLSELLNVARDKRIDTDVSKYLVTRHLFNYGVSHPYTDKLVINLFNAGDASVFAQSLIELEKIGLGFDLNYEIRLFSDGDLLQTGEAFKDLLDPESAMAAEAEVFSQASPNRLFPKLRFSLNSMSDFVNNHDKYQAHLSFLINPFAVETELARPNELKRSFFLNGALCRNVIDASREGKSYVWKRYFSNKTMPNPSDEWANTEVSIFARLQDVSGKLLSSTVAESVPATTLRLKEADMMLLAFVHECSDWVVTFDKNMGPEFYDLPCLEDDSVPYLLDYIPREETTGISSFLTTKPTTEIASLMIPVFKEYGIDIENKRNYKEILEDVRSVSSSLLMQVNSTSRKSFEVLGTILTKRFLEKKGIMREAFMIPIDLHKDFFEDLDSNSQERADSLVVKINPETKEILFHVVEIKCRNAHYNAEELHEKMTHQMENTVLALRSRFEMAADGYDSLDRELRTLELRTFLEFYINRASRYNQLNKELADSYLVFLSKLSDGYSFRFKQTGVVFDFTQQERQKKAFCNDALIYTMGHSVIDMILDDNATLSTHKLEQMDNDFIDRFEPSFRFSSENQPQDTPNVLDAPLKPKPGPSPQKPVERPAPKVIEVIVPETPKEPTKLETHEQPSLPEAPEMPIQPETPEKPSESGTTEKTTNPVLPKIDSKPEEPNYSQPKYDVVIGTNEDSRQYGILGKVAANGRVVGIDLNDCHTISLFGVQGAGKSYTIGSITEMVLRQFPKVNHLPAPMASVIFHYSDSMDYAPEFTSMVYPNDKEGELAKLKAEYGAEPDNIKDVVLLAPKDQVAQRKSEYPHVEVYPIEFDSSELQVKDWMFLLGATGNDSTYIKELKQIMKEYRHDLTLENLRNGVANSEFLSASQCRMAEQRLRFAAEYIKDSSKLQRHLKPGRLVIVDLRDELIEKEEALGLFVVMLNIFSSVMEVNNQRFNKFIVFDEAHKYMNDRELVDSITTAIREMRHKGVSIMIASQDPMSLPTEIIELSSIVVMHRFCSPAWVKHVQKAVTPLQNLTASEMSSLGSGEAFVWAGKSSDKTITQRPIKVRIRPRVTKHGGGTIQAVK